MFNFLKRNNTADEKEIIEIKKKIAYMETDISILKSQYQRLLDRYKFPYYIVRFKLSEAGSYSEISYPVSILHSTI